jgi:teichuronic acid biosynthesis glycosyltransferase TuaH
MKKASGTYDFVIVGQQSWDTSIGSNSKNIALELSRTDRVLYVNSPLERSSFFRGRKEPRTRNMLSVVRGYRSGIDQVSANLWVLSPDYISESINWLPHGTLFRLLNKYNNRMFARVIAAVAQQLGFSDIVLFNDNEMIKAFYLPEFLRPALSIYYSRDYMLGVDYWRRHGKHLEPAIMKKMNLALTNSLFLLDYCKRFNPDSYFIGQGCDISLFKPAGKSVIPSLFPDTGRPVIGYVGSLDERRLDIDLLFSLASSLQEYTFMLVGPETPAFQRHRLHLLSNVVFSGMVPVEETVRYMQHFDVCINPQLVNEITIGNYPRKIDEYLAVGKPVVATRTQAMEYFKDYVYLATGKEEYINLIKRALIEDNEGLKQRRRGFSAQHTWENNVNEIKKIIRQHRPDLTK